MLFNKQFIEKSGMIVLEYCTIKLSKGKEDTKSKIAGVMEDD